MYANKVKKIAAIHDLSGMGRVSLTVVIPIFSFIYGLSSLSVAYGCAFPITRNIPVSLFSI